MSIYKDCDVRGIYPKEITADACMKIGSALATLCNGENVLVGGDLRLSTPELKQALMDGLLRSGAAVTDLGTIPTPALYFALRHGKATAGATVTASHNPPEYNGIKFMIGDKPVTRETIDKLQALAEGGPCIQRTGTLNTWNVTADYLDFMEKRFHAPRPLHVLVDAGNGAMCRIAPEAFRRAGYRVTELFCEPDGSFPNRSPNPADYSCLGPTGEAVRACGADFGVAFDGDGDRAVFLDETGTPVQNEKALVMFIRALLRDHPTPVVYDQKSSSVVRDAVLEMGGTPLPERSGHAFIKRRFLENGAAIAGEVSGHFFFGELGYDDGLFAALTMAQLLAEGDMPLSRAVESIHCPPITPDLRFFCSYADQQKYLDSVEALARADGATISHLDGTRADYPQGWLLLRKSVTAEQMTMRVEARDMQALLDLVAHILRVLPEDAGDAVRAQMQKWQK